MPSTTASLPREQLVLGRYRPMRPLGSGGSGSVWLARDEVSGLDVALKIVSREGKAGPRAEREAEAAARLRHRRCLRVHALGHDDGHSYIVQEYVPGRTLREALRVGELSDADAIEAAAQILDGLAHAHARGIVHRDVKPANVLLADGPRVSVRLLDFGLAQMDEAETLTAIGDVPGTLAYIAPERLGGDQATPSSDVWAVGVILWEALAGGHPFWKPSLLESARAIEAGAAPLASVRPDLPRPLLAAVDRALSLEPARRPSAAALAAVLRSAGRRRPERTGRLSVPRLESRLVAVALTGLGAATGALALPFYPSGWPIVLAALAAAAAVWRPWLGASVALAVPLLPLGNVSLGLALAYAVAAAVWLVLFGREVRWALLPALGPVLGPAIGLLPLASSAIRSPLRRVLAVALATLLTAPPAIDRLGIVGSKDAEAVAGALARGVDPALALQALALGLAAAALPFARGLWPIAGWGAATIAGTLLVAPEGPALPLVLAVWATCVVLGRKAPSRLWGAAGGAGPKGTVRRSTGPESTVPPGFRGPREVRSTFRGRAASGDPEGGSAAREGRRPEARGWR